ncbi:MAG: transketolase family protein [Rudaea sp.]
MARTMGKPTRDAFGEALRDAGDDERIVVVDGDVNNSTRTEFFAERYPERFFNVGIAESNLVGVASGLAAEGKTAVAASFSVFLTANAYDQIRMGVALPGLNVKLVGSHAGVSIGEDGPSQMAIEDIALTTALGGFTVIVPADEHATRGLTREMLKMNGPVFLRTGRPKAPVIYDDQSQFEIGEAMLVRSGNDVTIIANGLMVARALDAAESLAREGIQARVLDMHTVKPLDRQAIKRAASETRGIVVCEEHVAHGGLGAAVAMEVATLDPVPMRFVNLGDKYAESGKGDELMDVYGLSVGNIVQAATELASVQRERL